MACVVIAALVCDHLECKHDGLTLKRMDELLSKEVYKHYKAWCKRNRSDPTTAACSHRFSCARFGKDTWASCPELTSIFKAAVVKTMIFWCLQFLKDNDVGIAGGELRVFTMHAMAKFQRLIDDNGPFFTPTVTTEVVQIIRKGLVLYQKLASLDRKRTDGRKTFKITPKFHSLLEMSFFIEQTNRNPR